MINENEIKKGNVFTLNVSGLSSECKGISKTADGYVIFIPGTYPGDIVKAKISKRKKSFAEAQVLEIITPSENRIKPECRHFGVCGGCKMQDLNYNAQADFKTDTVMNAFKRIGEFNNINVLPLQKPPDIYYYRNKMEFSFTNDKWVAKEDLKKKKEEFALGLHVPGFHSKILDIEECRLQSVISFGIVNFTREFFKKREITIYSTSEAKGFLRFLIIRQSRNTADIMVNIITYDYDKSLMSEYKNELLLHYPAVTSLVNGISKRKAQTAFADEINVIHGNDYILEKLRNNGKEYIFKISPNSFFQTNTAQAENLLKTAILLGEFNKEDSVLDLYCGAGSIAIFISDKVKNITGVELIQDAVANAKENSLLNGISNTEFICSDIRDFLIRIENDKMTGKYNKVILDPPRSGLHPEICEILKNSAFEKIIYVSCNPSTQARDLKIICSENNYRLGRIQPVDMFPQTYHIENVAEVVKIER